MPFKINLNSLTRNIVTLYIFLFSYFIAQFYTSGDQLQYHGAFNEVKGLGLIEAFAAYHIYLSTDEPIYFLISWIFSNLDFSKNIVMSIANALLANILFRVLKKLNTSIYIIVFIICTNYYLFGLYFAAERLKFAFIFLFLAFLIDENVKRKYLFLFLSFISHIQVLVILASSLFANTIEGLLIFVKKFKFKFNPRILVVIFVLGVSLLFLNEHLLKKFYAWSEASSSSDLISNTFQIILFLFLSLLYTVEKRRTIWIFIFILISASILGPNRINMMAYMFFMFYSLKINKGFNLGLITTSLYFSIKSIFFLINVFQFGHAYP
jgi:hypothetical protein